jgi:C4-dicarboxylate-specific signal transduction histidine kinase
MASDIDSSVATESAVLQLRRWKAMLSDSLATSVTSLFHLRSSRPPQVMSLAVGRPGDGEWADRNRARSEAEIKRRNEELEQRVVERTSQLMLTSEALREAQMELAHANRVTMLGRLAASIAHEVKQPITAAVASADAGLRWLAAQPPDLDEVRNAFDEVVRAGTRAGEVIDRIGALIKNIPARKTSLDINETILETLALTRIEMMRHRVVLQTELAKGLPHIWGDQVELQQVMLNLIMNAVDAMSDPGKGMRDLLVSTAENDSKGVLVAVRDSGPGLSPASLERLFDPFYTTKPGGMGMGLSICRSIVEAHGGWIWAEANVPRGATFQFILPSQAAS